MKKTVRLAAFMLAMVLMLTACGTSGGNGSASGSTTGASSADATSANTLRVVLNSEPSNLDPHNNTRLTAWAVQEEIFDKLVTKDENGNIQPDLASSWKQIDDLTWQFKLRDDVTFHDGSKLTSADVVFSFQRACSASGSQTFFFQFDPDNIKAVDDYTVNVATKQPFAAVLNYLASARGAILCKSAVESMGDEAYGRAPVGSGPYKVDNWTTGNSIVLTRNDNYWGDKPACSKIEFRFITEATNRAIELETGGADI
ncbi:MAG: ABC transporter substrate-binding protein, partial [Lawsonibacter sp.]|nr:ABC transporter substrate-binding protein [Lawsonibacter sp.]